MMVMQQDARRAMPGLRDLFFGRPRGFAAFNVSLGGFWRVFLIGFGALCLLESLWAATGEDAGLPQALDALSLSLSMVGGITLAAHLMVGLAVMEEWDRPVLLMLVPFAWLGVAAWGGGLLARIVGAAMALEPSTVGLARFLILLIATFTAWQTVRIGLRLTAGAAGAVVMTAGMATFGGFILVSIFTMVA